MRYRQDELHEWPVRQPGLNAMRGYEAFCPRLAGVLAGLCLCGPVRAADPALPTVDELQQALMQLERATAAFRVRCEGTEFDTFPGPPRTLKIRYELVQDASGKLRCDFTRQAPWFHKGNMIINWHRSLAVWDGTRAIRLDATDRAGRAAALQNFHTAIITNDANDCVPFTRPQDYIHSYPLGRASEVLVKEGTRTLGRERTKVGEAIVIETKEVHTDASEGEEAAYWGSRFHIVPELAFAVTYSALLYRRSPMEPWREYWIFEGMNYARHDNGVWLPRRIVLSMWDWTGDEPAHLTRRTDLTLDWEMDPTIDEETFTLKIPAGIMVHDKVQGKSYIHADVTDQMIADQVAAARRLAQEQGAASTRPGGARMLFAACVAVVVAAAIVVWRVKRRRKAA